MEDQKYCIACKKPFQKRIANDLVDDKNGQKLVDASYDGYCGNCYSLIVQSQLMPSLKCNCNGKKEILKQKYLPNGSLRIKIRCSTCGTEASREYEIMKDYIKTLPKDVLQRINNFLRQKSN